MSSGLDIGTLSGRIELEDKLSSAIDIANQKIEQLDAKFGGLGRRIAEGATSFLTAEAAIEGIKKVAEIAADALAKLTVEGASAADVAENFDRLNAGVGRLGETLLGKLKAGVHGTIEDLTLMKMVNQDLAAGMNLTDEQFTTLSKGAFALAQATGVTVKDAMEKMNDAMLTGKTRAVALLTGKIDLAAAEDAYAAKLGTTADRLSAEEKLDAARVAILDKVGASTERLGVQMDGIDEYAAQASVAWANFQDQLGQSVATSPVIMTMFSEIKSALTGAFGGDQATLIKTITNYINEGAISAVEYAKSVVNGVALAGQAWNELKIILETVVSGYQAITYALENVYLWTLKAANFASGGSLFGDAIKKTEADIERLYNSMAQGDAKITQFRQAQDDWAVSTGHVNEKLDLIEGKMKAAQAAANADAEATTKVKTASDDAATASEHLSVGQAGAANSMRMTADEAKKYAEALKQMKMADEELAKGLHGTKGILSEVDDEVEKNVKKYLEAGVALDKLQIAYKLTDRQAQAISDTWKDEKKKLDDVNAAWTELNGLGKSVQDTLRGVSGVVQDQVGKYLQMGASLKAVKDAYGLTDAQIKAIQQTLKDEQAAWAKSKQQVDENAKSVRTLSGEYITLAEAKTRASAGGSFDINRGNLAANLKTYGIPESVGIALATKGFSFQEIIQAWKSGMVDTWKPQGPRIPGFKEGGVGDFGSGTLAMLHGKEAIVPLDDHSIGGATVTIYVNGTADEAYRKIKDIWMKDLSRSRQFSMGNGA